MALVNCPDCHGKVSELAVACPRCGAPIARILRLSIEPRPSLTRWLLALSLFAGFVLLLFSVAVRESEERRETLRTTTRPISRAELEAFKSRPRPATRPAVADRQVQNKVIAGLTPVDVYLNLTNRGFRKRGPEQMGEIAYWELIKDTPDVQYVVEIYGPNDSAVEKVTATVVNMGTGSSDAIAGEFLGFVATLPYDGSDAARARKWAEDNTGKQELSITIGAAKFTVYGKKRARPLDITAK